VLALPGRGRAVTDTTRSAADAVVGTLEAHPVDPPGMAELRAAGLTPPLLRLLVEERRVVRLSPEVVMGAAAYAAAQRAVVEYLEAHDGGATIAALRDHLGATRRLVVPLLEHLDAARVTVRDGDLRRLRRRPGAPA
jgi:selenocysteine-specific elongation factor